jgi:VWFA-related protein
MRLTVQSIVFAAIAAIGSLQSVAAQSEQRSVFASVVDKSGAPATDLTAGDFIVREDGLAREVLRTSTASEPLQIAILVDTSQVIEQHMLDLRTALQAFFKQMAGKHEISLIGTGERPTVLVDFTRDAARLEKALGGVFARSGSGTYLMDAIVSAGDALKRRKATRPTIVAITARGPEFSDRHHDSVLEDLRESGAALHTLVLTAPGAMRNDPSDRELELVMAEGTKATGGRREDLLTSMALTDRLQSLGNELNNQYQITYARPKTLLPPKALEVGTKRPTVTVRARRWP